MKIDKLTPEQIARFPEFVERWTKIGLCTDPADRPTAERAIAMMYHAVGLAPPQKIVWCGSPLSQGLTRAILLDHKFRASVGASVWDSVGASVGDSVGDSVRDSVWASVGDSVGDSVRDSVGASVGASVWDSVWDSVEDSVGASVWDSVGASVGDSVGDSVWASVWASVEDSVRASVWDSVGDSVRDSVYGAHEAGWISFYSFFRDVCSLTTQTDKLSGISLLAQSAGWALPHTNICWVSERHNVLARDERGLLHNISGPAVAYPDGWAIYAVHGVRVPEKWITRTDELSAEDVFAEQNVEVRRAGCELIGWDRVFAGINASLVDEDGDPMIGALYEGEIPGATPCGFLKVKCGTGRDFVIPVPKGLGSAIAAQAWIQGVKPSVWKQPEVRG